MVKCEIAPVKFEKFFLENMMFKHLTLSDPLMTLRKLTVAYIFLNVLLVFGTLLFPFPDKPFEFMSYLAQIFFSLGLITGVLPSRKPDMLYLRPFSDNLDSHKLRRTIDATMFPFRLAGVRDPGRRIPVFLRPLLEGVLIWIYASNRHMNLEANSDWRCRLVVSLSQVRGVILDFRNPTTSTRQELQICLKQMSSNRIFVICHEGDDEDILNLPSDVAIEYLSRENIDLTSLAKKLLKFGNTLPMESDYLEPDAFAYALVLSERTEAEVLMEARGRRIQYILGWGLAIGLFIFPPLFVDKFMFFLLIPAVICMFIFPTLWLFENIQRRRILGLIGLNNNVKFPMGLWFFPVGLMTIIIAFGLTVMPVYNQYNQKGRVLEIFMGPINSAKMSYVIFYFDNGRAPNTAELMEAQSPSPSQATKTEIVNGIIKITVVDKADKEFFGKFVLITPIVVSDNVAFICRPGPDFPSEIIPKFLCN
jgi:hypothetical protein